MPEQSSDVRVRIAPSPTGEPHVGTAYVAVFNLAFARKHGGDFVLRIEDTDRERSKREYEEKIIEGLQWLDLSWDEGPDRGGDYGPYRQSERLDLYRDHAQKLLDQNRAYECFCSRERLEDVRKRQKEEGKQIGYDGHCRSLNDQERKQRKDEGESYVIRLKAPDEGETSFRDRIRGDISFDNEQLDDQILLKSDGFPTYHLANVVDDHHMEISHVMRAEEWISSTAKHILLYDAFGWDVPVFAHLPLLRNEDESKISKRENPVSILWYREHGYLPEALVNFLSLMGFSMPDESELYSFDRLVDEFSFDRLRTTGPVFDMEKLKWVNGNYIRNLDEEQLAEYLVEGDFLDTTVEEAKSVVPLVQERLKTFEDVDQYADFLFKDTLNWEEETFLDRCDTLQEALDIVKASSNVLAEYETFSGTDLEDRLRDLAEELDVGVGAMFMSNRIALTARTETPPLFPCMDVMGREDVLQRYNDCIEFLENSISSN